MNVLIYIPDLTQDWGGVKQYAIGLLNVLAKDEGNTYFIYHNNDDEDIISLLHSHQQLKHIKEIDNKKSNNVNYFKRLANFFLRRLKSGRQLYIDNFNDYICKKYNIDVIHCPYQRLPEARNVKLITTLHDVQELHFPEFFSPEERAFRANCYLDILKRADKVIVSYKHVKDDLVKYFKVQSEKVQIILLEMGKLWFEKFTNADILPVTSLNVFENYLLFPGNTWPHKNHIRLLKAIAVLRDNHNVVINLVCSGHTNEFFREEISKLIKELNLEIQVVFLGIVDEQKLYSLYKNSLGVVIPTLYEAGSFPLMESILLGVPVICSNVTSLPDTIKSEEFLFDPYNIIEISNKIRLLWESEVYRNQSIENSKRVGIYLKQTEALQNFQNLYNELNERS